MNAGSRSSMLLRIDLIREDSRCLCRPETRFRGAFCRPTEAVKIRSTACSSTHDCTSCNNRGSIVRVGSASQRRTSRYFCALLSELSTANGIGFAVASSPHPSDRVTRGKRR